MSCTSVGCCRGGGGGGGLGTFLLESFAFHVGALRSEGFSVAVGLEEDMAKSWASRTAVNLWLTFLFIIALTLLIFSL